MTDLNRKFNDARNQAVANTAAVLRDRNRLLDVGYQGYYWLLALTLSGFVLYDALNPQSPQKERALFVLLLAAFSGFVAAKGGRPKLYIFALQQLLIVGAILSFGYIILNADELEFRIGLTTDADVFFGVMAIVIILIMTQRLFGWALPILAIFFLLYARFAAVVPEIMGGGLSNYSVDRIITFIYLSTNGFFGTVVAVMAQVRVPLRHVWRGIGEHWRPGIPHGPQPQLAGASQGRSRVRRGSRERTDGLGQR